MTECFIIMPISTPDTFLAQYGGDTNHFRHVLNHLFIPALENAGLKPIPPAVRGTDVIQANIVKNIENAELVLCDMSSLNPNVFFELGIRTAVNKPVCLVVDDVTKNVPFDIVVINHLRYLSALNAWELEDQKQKLSDHISTSIQENTDTNNALWRYFSLSAAAQPTGKPGGIQESLAYLSQQVQAMRKELGPTNVMEGIAELFALNRIEEIGFRIPSKNVLEVSVSEVPSKQAREQAESLADRFGFSLVIKQSDFSRLTP